MGTEMNDESSVKDFKRLCKLHNDISTVASSAHSIVYRRYRFFRALIDSHLPLTKISTESVDGFKQTQKKP